MRSLLRLTCASTLLIFFTSLMKDNKGINIGDVAPLADRKMMATNGEEYSIADVKSNNGVCIIFTCNTCPWVVGSDQFEGWEKQYNELASFAEQKNIGFILVNSNEAKRKGDDSIEKMREHSVKMSYTSSYVVDEASELANAFGAKTTPHVYLFDQDLKLIYMGSIDNSWDSSRKKDIPYLKNAMIKGVEGKKIKDSKTAPKGCSIKRV